MGQFKNTLKKIKLFKINKKDAKWKVVEQELVYVVVVQ